MSNEKVLKVTTPEGDFDIVDGSLSGEDQLPLASDQRIIKGWSAFLTGVAADISIPFFMIAFSGILMGLNWIQVLILSFLGQMIAGVLCLSNDWGARRFGVNFPVQARAVFGNNLGVKLITTFRALVGLVWHGIQTWLAAIAMNLILDAVISGYEAWLTPFIKNFIWFILLMVLQYFILHSGYKSIVYAALIGGPLCAITMIGAIIWAYSREGTLGPLFNDPEYLAWGSWEKMLVYLIMVIGVMAAHWANISDMARSMVTRKDTFLFIGIGASVGFLLSALLAIVAGSISAHWGNGLEWNIIYWAAEYPSLWLGITMLLLIITGAVTSNPPFNLLPCVVTLANFFPKHLSFKKSAVVASILAVCTFPWYISGEGSIFMSWLQIIGAWNGAIGAIVMIDYYLVRKKVVDFPALYVRFGKYKYWASGINWYAFIAFGIGIATGWLNNEYAFFIGAFFSAFAYYVLMKYVPSKVISGTLIVPQDVNNQNTAQM